MSFSHGKVEVSEKSKRLERIDNMFKVLNICWEAPLTVHLSGRYQYEVILSLIKTILNDVYDKLTDKEKEEAEAKRKKLEELFLDKNKQIFIYKHDDSMRGRRQRLIKNNDNWKEVEELLYMFDRQVRGWVSAHMREEFYMDMGEDVVVDEEHPYGLPPVDADKEEFE